MKTCDDVRPALAGYHLGLTDEPSRDAIDAHLGSCGACLRDYLSAKRVHEDAGAFDERPEPEVHARLRAAVRRRRPLLAGPRWAWAFGAAAAAALLVLMARALAPAPSLPPPASSNWLIDSTAVAREDHT